MNNKEKEIASKSSLYGAHKDDFDIYVDDKLAKIFSSQGQQRSIALSMKLSEGNICYKETKEYPVFLFDDVLSELDSNRQNYLLNTIGNIQTIITCTGLDEFVNNRFEIDKLFKVTEGTVSSEN